MSAKGYLGLAPGSAYILKCEADPSFFLPHEKYFKYRYPSRDIWSFFTVAIEGSAFYVHSGFAMGQSGVCSGSIITDLKQTPKADLVWLRFAFC